MTPRRRNSTLKIRIFMVVCAFMFFYYMARIQNYQYHAQVLLSNVPARVVWEFVADFSNMKILNPTIVDFTVLEESGNYEHWKYKVEYTERLSHWPYLMNHNTGNFSVQKSKAPEESYYIYSSHRTCLLSNRICLYSVGEFKIQKIDGGTAKCEESVMYECPTLASIFCEREVRYQREHIMKNLKTHFHTT